MIGGFVLAAICIIVGIIIYKGKANWLIAGYHAKDKIELDTLDDKELAKIIGALVVLAGILLAGAITYRIEGLEWLSYIVVGLPLLMIAGAYYIKKGNNHEKSEGE